MKTEKTPTINLDQELELQYVPDFQTGVFTVTGEAEAVIPIADEIKAVEATVPKITHQRASKAGETIVAMSTSVRERVIGRLATDIKTIAYDRTHGTSFYDALQQKRADERNLKFAVGLGLISLTDVSCRKHEHAVAKMRGL